MKPGASRGALLYATGYFNCGYNIPYTCVYSYPSGELVGSLAVGDTSICSDRKGNIFFPDQYNSSVLEYAHGATMPFAQLADPGQRPVSCSVDSLSGDVAVVNSCALSSDYCVGPGSVAIYRRAKGTPKLYSGAGVDEGLYDGYDGAGDLFVDGLGPEPSPAVAFAELPRDGASLMAITIDRIPKYPARVQWDGSAMTIEDLYPTAIYRLKITGSTAKRRRRNAFSRQYRHWCDMDSGRLHRRAVWQTWQTHQVYRFLAIPGGRKGDTPDRERFRKQRPSVQRGHGLGRTLEFLDRRG